MRGTGAAVTEGDRSAFNVQNEQIEQIEHTKKPSKKLLATVEWLKLNDPDLSLDVRTVASKTGVSIGTVQNARTFIRAEQSEA